MAEILNSSPKSPTGSAIRIIPDRRLWLLSGLIPPLGLIAAVWLLVAKKLRRLALATLVITVLSAGIYGYLYSHYYGSGKYGYSYKNLTSTQIKLPVYNLVSDSITIQKPPEFQVVPGLSASLQEGYRHTYKKQIIANFNVSSAPIFGNYYQVVAPIVAANLKKSPSSTDYKSVVAPLASYVQTQLPKSYKLNLGTAQTLTTSHIKTTAWQFDFTATRTASNNQTYLPWQGKLLYIFTEKHFYYIAIETIQKNWQPNANVWQQMINSLQAS